MLPSAAAVVVGIVNVVPLANRVVAVDATGAEADAPVILTISPPLAPTPDEQVNVNDDPSPPSATRQKIADRAVVAPADHPEGGVHEPPPEARMNATSRSFVAVPEGLLMTSVATADERANAYDA